jgi:multidrug efflux pump subunit AcrB
LHYDIDSDAASRAGLSTSDVADDLATALRGTIVGSLPRLDRLIPVRVHFSDDVRFRVDLLGALPVALRDGQAPISRLAPIVRGMSPSLLFRENLSPAALGSGDVEGGNLGGLARDIRNRLAALPLPAGYSLEVGGRVEGQARAFEQMIAVFSLGLFAVFTVLVAQFRSARAALLVLLTVPLAVSGGLLFLAATRVTLNVSSLMGLVLLIGLVVKNGILLIQNTLLQREQGLSVPDALAAAGRRRLRPILMTTLCTVFGLLPLALSLGTGSELQRPLAVVVIGGLTFSTIATLLILPTLAGIVLPAGSR